MPSVAYSYIRMSTRSQLRGDSLRRQLEASEAYARKHGLVLDTSLRDLGVSAFEGKNVKEGALGRFLALVEAGEVERGSYLLIESLDRLSRNKVRLAMPLFLSLINAGVRVVTLNDGERIYNEASLDKDDFSLMSSLIVMSRANEESATKRDRISKAYIKARIAAREGGKPLWGNYPAWISRNQSGELKLNGFVETVREIYKLADQGMGGVQIGKYLNSKPTITRPHATKKGWYPSYISKILRSRAVIGEFQPCALQGGRVVPDGPPIPDYFPHAVELDVWMRVQSLRRKRQSRPGPKGAVPNLFAGLCKCTSCRGSMTLRKFRRGDKYLYCLSAMRGNGCTASGGFRHEWLEEAVLTSVSEWHLGELLKFGNNNESDASLDRKIAAKQIQVERLEAEANNLVVAIGEKGLTRLVDRLAEIEKSLSELRDAVDNLRAERRIISHSSYRRSEAANGAAALISSYRNSEGNERVLLRTKISQALCQFITQIDFDAGSKMFTVVVLGGLAAYRFHRVGNGSDRRSARYGLKDSFSLVNKVQSGIISVAALVPHASVDGEIRMVEGADLVAHEIDKLVNNSGR